MSGIYLIINADDLGISRGVNDATFKLIEGEQVTSATLIANAPYIEDACKRAILLPNCSYGVHLNVTQFQPLTSSKKLKPLLDTDGAFAGDRIRQVSIDASLSDGIFEEFCAQIEKLQSLGVALSHIDSHHHVHTVPRLFPVLKRVQKRFQIRKVRLSRNIYGSHEKAPRVLLFKKALFNFLLKNYYRTETTQGFTDFRTFVEYGTTKRMKYRCVEAMVHLGTDGYEDDTELLETRWQNSLKFPVGLISYRDLR